jgi:hypothetical protein
MRTGAIYRAKLSRDGRHVEGEPIEYFKAATGIAISRSVPMVLHIYASTDDHGPTMGDRGKPPAYSQSGAILEFTYSAK